MQEATDSTTVIFAGDTNLRDQEVIKCGGLPDNVFDAWEFWANLSIAGIHGIRKQTIISGFLPLVSIVLIEYSSEQKRDTLFPKV